MRADSPSITDKTRQAIARINRGRQPVLPDFFARAKEVVVVASSSRGGSSIFTEILRHSPELIHCKGEINPFLVLAGLTFPNNGRTDDGLDATDAGSQNKDKLCLFEQEMARDAGVNRPGSLASASLRQRFLHDLLWRLTIQWPQIDLEQEFLLAQAEATLTDLCQQHGWTPDEFNDPQLFHALFLARMRVRYPEINPHYYDLAPELIRTYCPGAIACSAPPTPTLIEEPPYVLIAPRHPVDETMLERHPIILKTPSNVYRLPFLRTIFANARFRILHLVRHPADSINGLIDGWGYHGFFSHRLDTPLEIKGYSDRFPAWGRQWWKYDLPPGWQSWTKQPLEYVCGYQWRKAHQTILHYLGTQPVDSLTIPFEDVIGPLAARARVFARIADWLTIDSEPLLTAVTGEMAPVMATERPRQRRWFKKGELLRPVLTDPDIITTAQSLGYEITHELTG